jgi:hypothetical protein
VSHGRYVVFQVADVAIPRQMLQWADRGTTAAATARASLRRSIALQSSTRFIERSHS